MQYLGKTRETEAYSLVVCANGWQSERFKHVIKKGGIVVSTKAVQSDGVERILHYCKPCGDKFEQQYQARIKSQPKLL